MQTKPNPHNHLEQYSPELQDLIRRVEAALIDAGKKARKLAEQTGTELVIVERTEHAKSIDGTAPITISK